MFLLIKIKPGRVAAALGPIESVHGLREAFTRGVERRGEEKGDVQTATGEPWKIEFSPVAKINRETEIICDSVGNRSRPPKNTNDSINSAVEREREGVAVVLGAHLLYV